MKNFSIYLKIILSIATIVLLIFVWNFDNDGAFDSILTFLSIITGFSITALSIIASSDFSKNLYLKESSKNNSLTLLHELVYLFRKSTLIFISGIMLILFYEFLPTLDEEIAILGAKEISISSILKAVIWFITGVSFMVFINLLLTFSKFIIRSVSNKRIE
ncbi:MAG: hypothetical protein WD059_06495 [Balneolaceae bacterium]